MVRGDTVASQVAGVRAIVEEHLGRLIVARSGGRIIRRAGLQMRREDGPAADRELSEPLLAGDIARLARGDVPFDTRRRARTRMHARAHIPLHVPMMH